MYGKNQVHALAQHFTGSIPLDNKQSVGNEIKTEFVKLRYDLLTWKEEIAKECYPLDVPCKVTATEWNLHRICKLSYFYPQLSNVTDIMLSTPVSNAWPERVEADCVKQIKTRFRSKLQKLRIASTAASFNKWASPWHRCCQIANHRESVDLDSCKV